MTKSDGKAQTQKEAQAAQRGRRADGAQGAQKGRRMAKEVKAVEKLPKPTKRIQWQKLRLLMERVDERGNPIPFRFKYVSARNGDVIDGEEAVTIGVDTHKHAHLVRMTASGVPRRLRDILILQVDEWRTVVT